MILDLSFAQSQTDEVIIQESINNTTCPMAPEAPVKELGNMLPQILDIMVTVPPEEHIQFSKMDLANGYWQMVVDPASRWNFAYIMPSKPGTPTRLVVPSTLQIMGWNESPAYLCAMMESIWDIALAWIDQKRNKPITQWRHSLCRLNPHGSSCHSDQLTKCWLST
jgi:hypothetical protein